ncbi:MAG: cyanophycin synthetase [Actinomycetota bacterium]
MERGAGYQVAIRGTGGILIEGRLPLLGLHNLDNALLAVALAVESGVDPVVIASTMHHLVAPVGRLEPVNVGQKFLALVDFAHSPDAVSRALATARTLTDSRVIAVLGCGGDRDRTKRPLMVMHFESDLISQSLPQIIRVAKIRMQFFQRC